MSVESMSKWIQLGANIGLILGLVFLGLQMKQDRELKRGEFVMNTFESAMNLNLALMGENPASSLAKAVYSSEELTPGDVLVVEAYLDHQFLRWYGGTVMEELGIFTGRWRSQENVSDWIFETGVGKRWLETERLDLLHPETRKLLEAERDRQASSPTARYRERLEYLRTGAEPTGDKSK